MAAAGRPHLSGREVTTAKAHGITYTPKALADFVAGRILECSAQATRCTPLRLLDPAAGQGQLLISMLDALSAKAPNDIKVHAYDTDADALDAASERILTRFPRVPRGNLHFRATDFLESLQTRRPASGYPDLFASDSRCGYDLVIANPPYVRTQVLGRSRSRRLARIWGLTGRIDLYHAFLIGIADMLKPDGVAGVIVSNRFMTTKAGADVRNILLSQFDIRGIWDLGDTKLFDASVLPAVLVFGRKKRSATSAPAARFVSIYETTAEAEHRAKTPLDALRHTGIVGVSDGRRFRVRRGVLRARPNSADVWRATTPAIEAWLNQVASHTWNTFGSLGKVRVGVKTCADRVFIRDDWSAFRDGQRPELLRPVATHRCARSFKPLTPDPPTKILYPHAVINGRRRAIDLARYPHSARYLAKHRTNLEGRKYLADSNRQWYELWVPQDPDGWHHQKLIFRDITAQPMFWVDLRGMVVNGDCYWWRPRDAQGDVLWLAAAIGNSTFIKRFYDRCFNNRLYSGRRRFMAQYVERFPLPDPSGTMGQAIIKTARLIFACTPSDEARQLRGKIDRMVFRAFGLAPEEVRRQ